MLMARSTITYFEFTPALTLASRASLIGKKHGEPLRRPKFRYISREVWINPESSSLDHHGLLIVCSGRWQCFVVAKLLYSTRWVVRYRLS